MSKGSGSGDVEVPKLEDLLPLMQANIDANRLDQVTPFGSITYNDVGPQPLSYEDWLKENPAKTVTTGYQYGDQTDGRGSGNSRNLLSQNQGYGAQPITTTVGGTRADYDKYASGFNNLEQEAVFEFSPEMQTLFDKQFTPDAYSSYADEYMSNYNDLLAPGREDQADRFQQSMFNRGLPEGSEVYGDVYRTTVGDPNSRQDLMAAQTAQAVADQRLMQDYNRLMAAMGGTALPIPNIDVMGPANMAMNANMTNANNAAQANSNIWNTAGTLSAAYLMSPMSPF
jgi:hypothetical protein